MPDIYMGLKFVVSLSWSTHAQWSVLHYLFITGCTVLTFENETLHHELGYKLILQILSEVVSAMHSFFHYFPTTKLAFDTRPVDRGWNQKLSFDTPKSIDNRAFSSLINGQSPPWKEGLSLSITPAVAAACVPVKIMSICPSQNHFWLNGHRIHTICPF